MFVFGGQILEKKHPSPSTQNHGLQACGGGGRLLGPGSALMACLCSEHDEYGGEDHAEE